MALNRLHMGGVLAAALLIVAPEAGRAAHPFITDDAGTQGAGKWQLELLGERQRCDRVADPGGGPVQQRGRTTSLNPVLTYGVLDNLDLALGLNHTRFKVSENGLVTAEASGASDSTVELKWRFHDEGPFSVALKPGVTLPTGNENRGLGTGQFAMLGAIYSPTDKIDFDIGVRKGLNRAEADTTFLIGATFRW